MSDWSSIRARLDEIRARLDAWLDPPPEARAAVLERRARALAASAAGSGQAPGTPVVVCRAGDERPAFVLAEVRRIARGVAPARVPGATPPWRQVILVDSVLLPAAYLAELLDRPRGAAAAAWCVAVDGAAGPLAVLVDEVVGTAAVDAGRLLPGRHPLVRGVTLEGLTLLDAGALARPSPRVARG